MLSPAVDAFWSDLVAGEVLAEAQGYRLTAAPAGQYRAVVVERPGHPVQARVLEPVAQALDMRARPAWSLEALRERMREAGLALSGPGYVHHVEQHVAAQLLAEALPHVRQLGPDDAEAFAAFHAQASEADREEASVELDHWAVVGAFEGDELAAVSSAYPWHGSLLADIGVLTIARFRGWGHARAVVRAMSRIALERGLQPLYRCDVDNLASAGVARAAGMVRVGTLDALGDD